MLQYRRMIQSNPESSEMTISMPLDIQIETLVGMILAIVGAIMKFTSGVQKITLKDVLAQQNKTYEVSANANRTYALRNI